MALRSIWSRMARVLAVCLALSSITPSWAANEALAAGRGNELTPVTVQVTDSDGAPLPSASVLVRAKGGRDESVWGVTDAQGSWNASLKNGAYDVAVQHEGGFAAYKNIGVGKGTPVVALQAEKAAVFTGKLTEANGEAAAGALVSFRTNPAFLTATQADGSFRVYVLPERTYHLSVDARWEGVPFAGEAPSGLDEENADGDGWYRLLTPLHAPQAGESYDLGTIDLADLKPHSGNGGGSDGGGGETPDVTPPAVPEGLEATASSDRIELQWQAVGDADLSGYRVYTSMNGGQDWDTGVAAGTATAYTVTEVTQGLAYTFAVTAVDRSGNESAKSGVVTAVPLEVPDTVPPAVPAGLTATVEAAHALLAWSAVEDDALVGYNLYRSLDGGLSWHALLSAFAGTSYTVSDLTPGVLYQFAVSAVDAAGNESAKSEAVAVLVPPSTDPTDPGDVAPEIPVDGSGTFASNNSFLFEGPQPIQIGVVPGAIEPERMSVLRGRALDDQGAPLAGVAISVLGYEELGRTLTRADGGFDLAVNGGGTVTVQYEKDGYMSIQRKTMAPWADFATLPDVAMKRYDAKATAVSLEEGTTEMQVAQGSPVTDADGTRQATLLIPEGTTAYMKLADGTTAPLPSMNVRATEYTVGENGLQAMPGELPTFVGYTYAVELSADEAVAAGATEVRFNQPLYAYVDNFLGFPVGEIVPSGYYDREAGAWVASPNGKVVAIVGVEGGMASVDTDGDGAADAEDRLAALGLTTAEREKLAGLYSAGQSFWRVPIEHFTPWDFNWPYGPPSDAVNPPNRGPNSNNPNVNDPCKKSGSVIGCQEQTLGEAVPIAGTNMTLNYYSRRSEGYKSKSTLSVPVVAGPLPASVIAASVSVEVAGKKTSTFVPLSQSLYTFVWDGMDAYDRQLTGSYPYTVTVQYHYRPVYYAARSSFESSFGQVSGGSGGSRSVIGIGRTSTTIATQRTWHGLIESPVDPYEHAGIEGWSLSPHHQYDGETGMISFGTGFTEYREGALSAREAFIRGTPEAPALGIPTDSKTTIPTDLAVGPSGDLYVGTYRNTGLPYPNHVEQVVWRVKPNGEAEEAAAMRGQLTLSSLVVDANETLYATSWGTYRIWKKAETDPAWVPIAGTGVPGSEYEDFPEGVPALEVNLRDPKNLEIAADGSIFFTDSARLYRIGSDGILTAFGVRGYTSPTYAGVDSGPVTKENVGIVDDIELAPDGSLYMLDRGGCSGIYCSYTRIRKMTVEGNIEHVAGNVRPTLEQFYDGIPAKDATFRVDGPRMEIDRAGNIYFLTLSNSDDRRLFRVTPEHIIQEVTPDILSSMKRRAKEEGRWSSGNVPIRLMGIGPKGDLLLQVQHTIGPDAFYLYKLEPNGKTEIADESGLQLFRFDPATGRHVDTVNTLTGNTIYALSYDEEGRLTALTDRNQNQVRIERDEAGVPTAIVAPGGQRTTLTVEQGRLTKITNPAGEAYEMAYNGAGLLEKFIDPNKEVRTYGYDDSGYLASAENPLAGVSTLVRESLPNGYKVTYTQPGDLKTSYAVTRETGALKRVSTDPSGAVTTSVVTDAGVETIQYPDGTQATKTLAPDPRWGDAAPVAANVTYVTPQGRRWTLAENRVVTLAERGNPLSVKTYQTTYTMTQTSGGKTTTATSTAVYDAAEKKFTETSAEGSVLYTYLDEKDRVAKVEESDPLVAPIIYSYDEFGRLFRAEQGDQFVQNTYDAKHRIEEVIDAGGQKKRYTYDDADRIVSIALPGGQTVGKGYDDSGNMTSITMPDQTTYMQTFNGLNQFSGFAPAGRTGGLTVEYTSSGKFDKTTLAGGREVDYVYDATGRINGLNDADIARTFTYKGATDLVSRIATSVTGRTAGNQAIDYQYDGSDVTGMTLSGAANGSFAYTYDGYSNLTGIRMTAGGVSNQTMAIAYDKDLNRTQFGPFAFQRTGPGKRIGAVTDGKMNIGVSYDDKGRIEEVVHTLNGVVVQRSEHIFDKRGFVTDKTVTTSKGVETYSYKYDGDGQLTEVAKVGTDGATSVESYDYVDNRNRILRSVTGSDAEIATYGDYDVLEQAGGTAYSFDVDGYLTNRGSDTFQYGARGELLTATVTGAVYEYHYDALGRRVARVSGGEKTQYLYGNPEAPHSLTATIDPNGAVTTYFYDEQGLLIAFERGGVRYYVITDAVGTPERVLAGDGTVLKELEYDSFGVLTSDSNPSFPLAIGFAGGIADEGTKLVRFGFRDYDPASGRWTARDPILFDANQANLYAYVNNNPVLLRDPCGLFCIGGSAYSGLGGGGKVCITDEGVSACAEVGLGVGGGLEINPFEDLSNTELVAEATGKASWGPASISAGYKVTSAFNGDCMAVSPLAKVELGPLGYDFMSPSESSLALEAGHFETDAKDWKNLFKSSGAKAEAALKAKGCAQYKW
ncbi:carboxypeptidase regulatory-like domain-containing protein [Paenibacillus antri]|uniref:carboxypeptidase regulatory-like domain-containing protein n=1 Tax=Paenibacillus antri TaxID=2582848 RepID=UPI001305305C|nr:carboxypeptidase regulatory-like domain-containing protein [Paenibacillus antri]